MTAVAEPSVFSGKQNEERILILAPVGRDGVLTARILEEAHLNTSLCPDMAALCDALGVGVGVILLTTEAIDDPRANGLMKFLRNQPPWSDLPLVLLSGGGGMNLSEIHLPSLGNVTVLERPVSLSSLLSTMQTALRARRRQYEVRDLLQNAEKARAEAEYQQQHIEALNERLQRAMTETHHRVKNNLQVIAAMVDMQLMDGTETIPTQEFRRLGMHVRMLAAVHDLLTQEAKEDGQANAVSARAILDKLLPLIQATAGNCEIKFHIEDARLSARQGTSLCLVVNELVSNAIKYGESHITLKLAVEDHHALLEVCDDGPGFPPDFNVTGSANTGLELVEHLAHWDLGGETTYVNRSSVEGGGACVRVTIPLAA